MRKWHRIERRRFSSREEEADEGSADNVIAKLALALFKLEGMETALTKVAKIAEKNNAATATATATAAKKGAKEAGAAGGSNAAEESKAVKSIKAFVAKGALVAVSEGKDGQESDGAGLVRGPARNKAKRQGQDSEVGGGGKRRKGILRSRNKVVDQWLGEDDVRAGGDAYADLEDFIA